MTTTTYGSKYSKNLDIVAIAKLVRADIKAAVQSGALPAAKYNVRIERFSGGKSIDVIVSSLPFEVLAEDRVLSEHDAPHAYQRSDWKSAGATSVEHQLDRIMSAYNFDGSDLQSDYFHVNFYTQINFDSDRHAERQAILLRNGRVRALESCAT